MATILSLPVELLIQIFSDCCISSSDLVNCRQSCKHFNEVADHCSINYTFRVDAVSRTTWKLIKQILKYPEIGKRFKTIRVTWHRRIPRKVRTWALQWKWSEDDRKRLLDILGDDGASYNISEAVWAGLNSESLLPVLLLHTPNLQSFDMGDAKLDVMGPYVSPGEAERVYNYCTVDNPAERIPMGSQNPTYPGPWAFSFPEEMHRLMSHYSFLYLHMRLSSTWLPGLSNITHFSHGCYRTGGYFDRWPASHLTLMMLLPRLQVAQFYGATILPPDGEPPLKLTLDPKVSGQKSTVKHLELLNCCLQKADYKAIAEITGSLRSFKCILEDEDDPWEDYAYETDVHDFFRLHNPNTLKNENISITRATGDDSDPKDLEKDLDYGEDDVFWYRSDDTKPCYPSEGSDGSDECDEAVGSVASSRIGDGNDSDLFASDG
ncbi:hypothetical protein TWF730_005305 [Orbilia blumenaviensis]|uniref:F-box domain-containing protein n=1 Tax=Orbilia blumenaviensis TaxID=1796055 RepID=A0AAV9VKD7_9PEZI